MHRVGEDIERKLRKLIPSAVDIELPSISLSKREPDKFDMRIRLSDGTWLIADDVQILEK